MWGSGGAAYIRPTHRREALERRRRGTGDEEGRATVTTAIDDHKKEIRDIVCKVLEIDPDELSDDDSFKDEHEMDSMGAIEILAALEQNYNITIDQSELVRMVNLSGVYDVVVEAAGWEREPAG
ncbi:hypothetical protein GCM10022226_30740 [Sphaerisporangium flaviroseum]|uniref:Carrier domain-containing protein n=1 Tax=Sphaerisporangium flaviroseum TaxID=509199 RepID=A0ABP7HZV9_9ACTN